MAKSQGKVAVALGGHAGVDGAPVDRVAEASDGLCGEIVGFALRRCRELLAAEGIAILMADAAGRELRFTHVADAVPEMERRLLGFRFPADCGIAGRVWRSRQSTRVDDTNTCSEFWRGVDAYTGRVTRSVLSTPLAVGGKVVGVVQAVNSMLGSTFPPNALSELEHLSETIGRILQTLRLGPDGGHTLRLVHGARSAGDERESSRYPASTVGIFRNEGDYWTLAFDNAVVRLKDCKGLRYLSLLVAHPRRQFHALELAGGHLSHGAVGREAPCEAKLDGRAKTDYRRRLVELRQELDEPEGCGDLGRTTRLREEIGFLEDELSAALGLGGRDRSAPSSAERARSAVTKRISDALMRIAEAHPSLGRHFLATVRTGTFCAYEPGASACSSWQQ